MAIKAAVLDNGIVVNVFLLNTLGEVEGAVPCPDHVGIGDTLDKPFLNELTLQDFKTAHDEFLNAPAKAKQYDSIITAALRAGYPGPFHDEGILFATWMDECNVIGYQVIAEITAGTRPMFNSVNEYLALLPPCPVVV